MKVYIVGKVTGVPAQDLVRKFDKAKEVIRAYGDEPVSPIDNVDADSSWSEAMKICIPLLISCDAYYCIDKPHTTAGGMIEVTIAGWLGIEKRNEIYLNF